MIEELSQETVTEYANEALTIQEPQGTDYTQGAKVGKTIPAKWWNWLFNAVTKRLNQAYNDFLSVFTEVKNVILDAGLTPSASDNTQLTQAVRLKTDAQIHNYLADNIGFLTKWTKLQSTRALSKRFQGSYSVYVIGDKLQCSAYNDTSNTVLLIFDKHGKMHITRIPLEQYSQSSNNPSFVLIDCGEMYLLRARRGTDVAYSSRFSWYISTDLDSFTDITDTVIATIQYSDGIFTRPEDGTIYYFTYSGGRKMYTIDSQARFNLVYTFTPTGTASTDFTGVVDVFKSVIYGNGIVLCGCYFDFSHSTVGSISDYTVPTRVDNASKPFKLRNGSIALRSTGYGPKWYIFSGTINIPATYTGGVDYNNSWFASDAGVLLLQKTDEAVRFTYDGVNFTNAPDAPALSSDIRYKSGVYMWGRYRSRDLLVWEELTSLAEATDVTNLYPIKGVAGIWYSNTVNQKYVWILFNDGDTAVKVDFTYISVSNIEAIADIQNSDIGSSIVVWGYRRIDYSTSTVQLSYYQTQLTRNRVLGSTLYLQ